MHFIPLLFGKQKKQPLSIAPTCATTLIKRKKGGPYSPQPTYMHGPPVPLSF
jgi:hypothetical protein